MSKNILRLSLPNSYYAFNGVFVAEKHSLRKLTLDITRVVDFLGTLEDASMGS